MTDWPHSAALWVAKLAGLQLLWAAVPGFDPELLREALEEALGHAGHHVAEGHAVWAAGLAWEEAQEAALVEAGTDPEPQTQRVRALYARALHAPLEGLEQLWAQYEAWECEEQKKSGLQKRLAAGRAAREVRRPWEARVVELAEPEQGQNAALWAALGDYLSFEEQQLGGKKERGRRDPAPGTALFDRGLAVFAAVPELWLRFLSFLCKWTPAESWPRWAARARRHCPWSGVVLAAAARVLAAAEPQAARELLAEALAGGGWLATAEDFHAAYCAYADLTGTAEAAEAHLALLEQHFPDRGELRAEALEHLAALALRAGDAERFHACWEAALRAQGATAWDPWSRYLFSSPLGSEQEVGRCRSLFKRAVHAVLDNPAAAFEAWRRWERRWGTSATQLEAACALERRGRAVAALRLQWQKKEVERAAPEQAAAVAQQQQPPQPAVKEEKEEEERTRRTVCVRNLLFEATEVQVRELFAPFGEVAAVRLARDAATGAGRGFGFVEFGSAAAAAAALAADGRELLGRRLAVAPSAAGAATSGLAPRRTLYVSNLPYDARPEDVAAAFAASGATAANPIEAVRLLKGECEGAWSLPLIVSPQYALFSFSPLLPLCSHSRLPGAGRRGPRQGRGLCGLWAAAGARGAAAGRGSARQGARHACRVCQEQAQAAAAARRGRRGGGRGRGGRAAQQAAQAAGGGRGRTRRGGAQGRCVRRQPHALCGVAADGRNRGASAGGLCGAGRRAAAARPRRRTPRPRLSGL